MHDAPFELGVELHLPFCISVIGIQNAGKTTLAARMIAYWQAQGLRVAALKHDGHADGAAADDWEKTGSDTRTYAESGARFTMVAGGGQTLLRVTDDPLAADAMALCTRLTEFAQALAQPLDVIVVEGFKRSSLPKVVCLRRQTDAAWFTGEHLGNIRAIVCLEAALPLAESPWPMYHGSDIARLCDDLLDEHRRSHRHDETVRSRR